MSIRNPIVSVNIRRLVQPIAYPLKNGLSGHVPPISIKLRYQVSVIGPSYAHAVSKLGAAMHTLRFIGAKMFAMGKAKMVQSDAIIGCLLGTAVGDALGLPYEGLSPRRGRRLLGPPEHHRLVLRRGMVSDDTEHTLFVVQALISSDFNPQRFERDFSRSLRWWLAGLPVGTGLATLRACLKLWLGFVPERSGVFSAGNGPAMRSAMLGLVFGEDVAVLSDWVLRTTRITHTDPKAFMGALTVALAAHSSAFDPYVEPQRFVATVKAALAPHDSQEFVELIHKAAMSAQANQTATEFAHSIGSRKGVSGYVLHTVPCVIQTWLKTPTDFAQGLQEIIAAGGDTDTTGAILGAIIGARVGENGIPQKWRTSIVEWPRTLRWIKDLGHCLAMRLQGDADVQAPGYCVPGILPRNLIFFLIVMFHGLRRLAPPY